MLFISKQLTCQKYIYKIHSSRLRNNKWNLILPIDEARRNDEVISLADSQILRWIDELNNITDADEKARNIKSEIRRIRKSSNTPQNKKYIKQLYSELDKVQFKPDYMCLIIDKKKDYYRAVRGFSINGIEYKRLLGTNGGIKNSTIVFVSKRLYDELSRRVDNGRDTQKELVTAKLEAYKALTCSASIPVSFPNGVLVVDDAETEFFSDVIYLTDEGEGEPVMEERKRQLIKMNASDGYGMILPSLAKRWSEELDLDYVVSGVNTRFSFEKGMAFTFDFVDFAEKIAKSYVVKDVWGDEVDVRDVEIVLTASMVKLWDSYKSCSDYIETSKKNGYTFCVTKTSPKGLENERSLNYQFIQSYDLSDEDIEDLIRPTMDEIQDVLCGDWRKTILFLKGAGVNSENVERIPDDYVKAIMIDERMMKDPFVQNSIYNQIRKRIDDAKIGVIKVHGNYSIVSGDPYLLCQSMFGLEKTGLLKAGEIYNKYWADIGADKLACFRAPMTCHNNIRLVHSADREELRYWFRYIETTTVLNSWDTITMALNGCDFDGDLVMLTDNNVLVSKLKPLPALMCVQRKAEKRISVEDDFVTSNIESFGNAIGPITNRTTGMFEVKKGFSPESKESDMLSYRIMCGQLFQQNEIDKSKGIISKPMPRTWFDRHAVNAIEDEEQRALYRSILADKKPYFMRYIYPALMSQYNTYIKNTNKNCLREFKVTVDELIEMERCGCVTDRQKEFLKYYRNRIPVGVRDCVMNRICRRFEKAFDGFVGKQKTTNDFDYTIMRSPSVYTPYQFNSIKKIYDAYNRRLSNYAVFSHYERLDESESYANLLLMNEEFIKQCSMICPDRSSLCNIILDLCYKKQSTKSFAWNMCGSEIIHNLLMNCGRRISFPVLSDSGDIEFCGRRYIIEEKEIEVID